MKFDRSATRSARARVVAAVLGVAALGATGLAQAGDVYWSLGVSSPGVAVGVANAPPVYVQPAPVYVAPAPVYVQPRPVYVQPRPVYYGAPTYYAPGPVYQAGWAPPGRAHGWHKKHHRHHHDWDD